MNRFISRNSYSFEQMVLISAILHIALFFLATILSSTSWSRTKVRPVYYIDLVNLPVAAPAAGEPAPSPAKAEPAPKPSVKKVSISAPAKAVAIKPKPVLQDKKIDTATRDHDLDKELAALEKRVAQREEEAALDQLRKRVAQKQKQGMPNAAGSQAGSDYASYLQSRLRDAFHNTIAMQSKAPEVVVKLQISANGRLTGYRVEKTSGDRVFEQAVARAISIAEKNFTPPPSRQEVQLGFVFKPQGEVGQRP